MSRFIAVIHGWHVHSNGFTVQELEADNHIQADKEAAWLKDQRERDFDKCAVKVIEICEFETLPRQLSWRERFSGKLKVKEQTHD